MHDATKSEELTEGSIAPWWHLHRRLYDWVLHWADTVYGGWALFALSFAESSFFPVPPEVLLAPLTLGNRQKWWRFATSCSLASVLGGLLGYVIGVYLWGLVGDWTLTHLAWAGFTQENFDKIQDLYVENGFWIIFLFGFTVLPFKLATITAGIMEINFLGFVIASAVGRSSRFFLVAGLFGRYGDKIKPFVDKYFNGLCILFLILLVGGFLLLKFFH